MSKEEVKEESSRDKQKKLALQKKFSTRITIARQGREAFLAKDYVTALKRYNEYLSILSESKEIQDIYALTPAMFNNKTQVTEMLLISHIYWEIARINEMTPKLQANFQKALSQFVKFTTNQPYQVLNAEMLRKYIKKNQKSSRQIALLNDAYSQIFVQSKKCYIATMCMGENHEVTRQLRDFKSHLLKWPYGQKLVECYYRLSSKLVNYLENKIILQKNLKRAISPLLTFFAKFTQTGIFNKCSYFLKSLPKNGSNH